MIKITVESLAISLAAAIGADDSGDLWPCGPSVGSQVDRSWGHKWGYRQKTPSSPFLKWAEGPSYQPGP